MRPPSVRRIWGMTDNAMNESCMNGSSTVTPSRRAATAPSASSAEATSPAGMSLISPASGSASSAATPVEHGHLSAAQLGQAGDGDRHVGPRGTDADDVVGVVGDGGRERAARESEARGKPAADTSGGVMALDDRGVGQVVLADHNLARERRQAVALHADRAYPGPRRQVEHEVLGRRQASDVDRVAQQLRDRRRRDRSGFDLPAAGHERAGAPDVVWHPRSERVEGQNVGLVAGTEAAQMGEAVIARRVGAGEQDRLDLRDSGGDRDAHAIVDVPSFRSVSGSRSSVQKAAPSVPWATIVGARSTRFWLADPWRRNTHMPLRRFSSASVRRVAS
jgi:hypothetical protein